MKYILISVCFLFYSGITSAYELNGYIHANDDQTFNVTLYNSVGRWYVGTADKRADDNFEVSVQDQYGEQYRGMANQNDHGTYQLDLQNTATSKPAYGQMSFD